MIKLVATDVDGTIIIPEKTFTKEVRDCITRLDNNGIKVVLVTGRMHAATKLIAQDLGLTTPVISYQGGLIKDGDKTLYERYLTKEQTEKIIAWGKEENIHLNLYNDDILYSEKDCYEVKRYCNNLHTKYTKKLFTDVEKNKVNKMLAIDYSSAERLTKLEKELPKIFPELYIVRSTPYFIEFSNKEASKYCAVRFLQKYWGISKEETLTIGDHNNDLALLQAGGIKVAMGNATDELKATANYITNTVTENGFVKAMEKFCNI